MPEKTRRRIKPVIEEVVEETPKEVPVEPVVEELTPVESTTEAEIAPEEVVEEKSLSEEKRPQRKTNLKLIIVITVISAFVAAVVSGGVYVYLTGLDQRNSGEAQSSPTPEPIVLPTESPAPTAEPELDLTSFSIQVLNGSGKIGAAGGGETVLKDAGFKVSATGNAGKYDYENTVIQAKDAVPAQVISELKDALVKAKYDVKVGDKLTSGNYDVVVIIGAN
jgi:hypothetical protein